MAVKIAKLALKQFSPDLGDHGDHLLVADNILPTPKGFEPHRGFSPSTEKTGNDYDIPTDINGIATYLEKTFLFGKSLIELEGGFKLKYVAQDAFNGDTWESLEMNNKMIFTDNDKNIQVLDLKNSADTPSDLTAIKAKSITAFKGFVVAGNIEDSSIRYPYTVKWSGLQDETTWTPSANTQSGEQNIIDGGDIVKVQEYKENCVIFLEQNIYLMSHVGGALIMRFTKIADRGLAIQSSVVKGDNGLYYMTSDGFYALRGNAPTPVGYGRINDWFWNNYNKEYPLQSIKHPEAPLIYLSFTDMELNRKVLIYNEILDQFTILNTPHSVIGLYKIPIYNLDQATDALDQAGDVGSWDDVPRHSSNICILNNGKLWVGNDKYLDTNVRTAYFDLQNIANTNYINPMYTSRPEEIKGKVYTKLYSDGPYRESITATSHNITGRVNVRSNGRFHSFEMSTKGKFDDLSAVEVAITGSSKR